MKTARIALLSSLLMLFLLTACRNEMPYAPDDEIRNQYTVTWVKTFGIIDPAQDWNMATSVTADIDPSAFGQGYTVNIYNADPLSGGVLIGRTAEATSLKLDVAKDAESVYVRAYTPDHGMFCEREFPIVGGKVDIRANSRAELPLSRADGADDPAGYQWILACEDLGSIGDYDFNDIVIGINYVSGDKKLTITPLAAGGTLKAIVCLNSEDLFESHYPINKQTAETGKYSMANTMSWGGPGAPAVERTGVDFSITDKMGGIKIRVIKTSGNKETETIIEAPAEGDAPQVICVRGDWEWPKETVSIKTAYPGFTDWSKNSASSDWNKVKVADKVVKRVGPSTPIVKHNSIKVTTTDSEPLTIKINGTSGSEITLESGLRYYLTEPLTSCAFMFSCAPGSSNLKSVDLSDFDASQVTSMTAMFSGCSSLEEIIWGDIDTSNVTDMRSLFNNCSSLKSFDLSHLDTSNVTNMMEMFGGCSSLTSIDLSQLDMSNVLYMSNMFGGCSSLVSIDLSPLNTSNVESMDRLFGGCSSLEEIIWGSIDTSKVKDMSYMFYLCSKLESIDLSPLNTSNVEDMEAIFKDCSSLKEIIWGSIDTSKVEDMEYMFSGCSSLESIDLSKIDTSNATKMQSMFQNCTSLTSINISKFNTSKVENMSRMFQGCSSLTSIDINPSINTSELVFMSYMFYGCSSLASIDLSGIDSSSVINMSYMFFGCSSLTILDLHNFRTPKLEYMDYMFSGCTSLGNLNMENFSLEWMLDYKGAFRDCNIGHNLGIYTNDTMKAWLISHSSVLELDTSNWLTSWP